MSAHSATYYAYVAQVALMLGVLAYGLAGRRELPWATWLLWAVVITGLAGLTLRSIAAGHLPIFGTFENTYAASWFLLAGALAGRATRWWRCSWRLAVPWAALLLTYGSFFRSAPLPLTISELSWWVDLHVLFAWMAFVPLLAAGTLGPALIFGSGHDARDVERMEIRAVRLAGGGFVALSAMLAVGSWYMYVLFGEFWRWDIVGTLTLVVWLLCTIVVHGRLFWRWSGRTLGGWLAALLVATLLAYWVWSVFPGTYHFFDIPLLKAY